MSVEAIAVVLHHSRATGAAKLVLVGIANHEGDGGSWPAVSTLARYAGITERNVQKSIGKLVRLGELAVYQQQGGTALTPSGRRTNRYEILVRCPLGCDRTTRHRVRPNPQLEPLPGMPGSVPLSVATPPVGSDTPTPVGSDALTTTNNHVTTGSRSVTDPRARELVDPQGDVPCSICSRIKRVCRRIYRDDHEFHPIG